MSCFFIVSETIAASTVSTQPTTAATGSTVPEEGRAYNLDGEYRLAGLVTRPTESEEEYSQLLNRLRLKFDYRATPALSFHLQQDFDVLSGSYLHTELFQRDKQGLDQPASTGRSTGRLRKGIVTTFRSRKNSARSQRSIWSMRRIPIVGRIAGSGSIE